MEDNAPEPTEFGSYEDLLQYLTEHVDDIESVRLSIRDTARITRRGKPAKTYTGIGAIVELCSGHKQVINIKSAEMLINQGVLQRMKIPCRLETQSSRPDQDR